jgi:hypothetical protein
MNRDVGASPKGEAVDASVADDTLTQACRALYVGGAGNVAVTMEGGGNLTFVGVAAGTILPIACTVVLNSGTTATSILALY